MSNDLQKLSNLFEQTLSPDPNVRKASELQIRKVAGEEGIIAALLQIIGTEGVDLATRQAASVYLKNRVHSSYSLDANAANTSRRPDQAPIAASDRTALKSHVLPLLASSPSRSITVQLASTFKSLVANDFPERWPTLLDDVKRLLSSADIHQVGAGCVAALECIRAFRFRQQSDILPQIVEQLMPTLVSIATQVMQQPVTTAQEIPSMLHLILKAYKTSIVVNLSAHQQSQDSFVPWGRLLFAVVNLQVPADVVPVDEEERERSEWWVAKKWAYGILFRLFHKFGNPSQMPSTLKETYGPFSEHFVATFAPEILNTYLRQVELFVSGQTWLSKKCQYQIFQFFTECVKPKSTWTLLKPHFQTLVSSFVFPQLSFTAAKQELWETDAVDYVRAAVDEYENYSSPVSSATAFLLALAGSRTKTTFIPILGFINNILKSNALAPQRFGALNMIVALGSFAMRHPDVKGNMEQLILQHVTPEFASPEPYMRSIACEVLATVEKFSIQWSSEDNLNLQFRAVATALDDHELPVRIQAALAMTELIVMHETVRDAVAPQVGKVIQDLLKMSDETDLDVLNRSMEVMVERFQTELLPVAAQLTARLCESYLRLAKEGTNQDQLLSEMQDADIDALVGEGDDDKTYAAMGVAKTISTIINSLDSSPEILLQVQEVIIPIIVFTLQAKILDLFDNMYDLIDSLTFKARSISPNMWPVFEETYKLFKSDAVDFLDEMLPSLDNFVSYGTDVFKARADYRQMVIDIYTTSITNDQLGENDRVNGCKLAESILLNLRGSVDDALQTIVVTAVGHIDKANTSALRLANLEVLINAVLYNPSAALHFMEGTRPGQARVFFDKWFAAINGDNTLPRVHDKKLSILALCALLELAPASIPATLQEGWPGIVGGVLKIFATLPKAIEDRKALEDAFQEDLSDDELEDDDNMLNMNEEEEDVWDHESAYLEMLAKEGARLRETKPIKADDEESDEESEEEIDEELGYLSPLDNVDPYVSFKQALTTYQMQNGPSYQLATTALTTEQQLLLIDVMGIAEKQSAVEAVVA